MTRAAHINKPGILAALAAAFTLAALLGACTKSPTDGGNDNLRAELIAEGEIEFVSCTICHGSMGEGNPGSAPPILRSDFVIADRLRPVRILLMGLPNAVDSANPITVNGLEYMDQMPAFGLQSEWSDRQIAAVVTYLRAVLNDSTSVNCVPGENEDSQPISTCTIIASPDSATTMVTPEEVAAIRDSLDGAGLLTE